MSNADSSMSSPWWRSVHVVVIALLLASVGPMAVLVRGEMRHREARARHEHERELERRRAGERMQQLYLDRAASPQERARVLRLLAANAHTDELRNWATAEMALVNAEVSKDELLHARRDTLQMEAFNLAAKALSKEPAALAEHYRQMGFAIADGRVASSGVIESLSGTTTQPHLSDLMHKLIDEKQACLASGKDEVACGDQVGLAVDPTLADFEVMRELEDKNQDPDAQRRLAELRKRFLKQ